MDPNRPRLVTAASNPALIPPTAASLAGRDRAIARFMASKAAREAAEAEAAATTKTSTVPKRVTRVSTTKKKSTGKAHTRTNSKTTIETPSKPTASRATTHVRTVSTATKRGRPGDSLNKPVEVCSGSEESESARQGSLKKVRTTTSTAAKIDNTPSKPAQALTPGKHNPTITAVINSSRLPGTPHAELFAQSPVSPAVVEARTAARVKLFNACSHGEFFYICWLGPISVVSCGCKVWSAHDWAKASWIQVPADKIESGQRTLEKMETMIGDAVGHRMPGDEDVEEMIERIVREWIDGLEDEE